MSSPVLHAVLGASSAHRWLACPPSARLGERFDNRFGRRESEYAKEGTKAHALGEIKIRNAYYHEDKMTVAKHSRMSPEEQSAYVGINDNRYKALREELGDIPEDMDRATDDYCNVVMNKLARAKEADTSATLLLEQRLDYSKWVPEGFGTGDCIIVSDSLLEVCDYKHGKGIPVEAHENPQLRLYGLGAYDRFYPLFGFPNVRMTIIQPRLENLSEETISTDELLHWATDTVVERAKLAWLGKGVFSPGEHCRFCSAKAVCSARVSNALKLYGYGMEQPGTLTDEQIADILPFLDDAEAWISDIRDYATKAALYNGTHFRGYKLVLGKKPNRQWANEEEVEAQWLRNGYPGAELYEKKLKPVGKIEKAVGKTAFRAIFSPLVTQGEGKPILVPEDDKRQEYSQAATVFGDMIDNENENND